MSDSDDLRGICCSLVSLWLMSVPQNYDRRVRGGRFGGSTLLGKVGQDQ